MAVSKVILNGNTLMDTTQKTVTANKMLSGETALDNAGENVTGNIVTRTSSDLTVSGPTVTAPAGHYASNASKSVASGSATPAATISATGASVSTGTNTLTLSKSVSNTPTVTAGYVGSGTAGNSSVSLTASVTTQAAQTIHPSTSDQTIASGRYLTGTQTVKGVKLTNLSASNIVSGVTVKVGDSTDDDCVTSVTGTASSGGSTTIEALNVTANGTYTAPSGKAYSPVTVNVSGGGSSEEGTIRFIDYDGTVLHEYTETEASALTALPANPTHTGLTSQGWNWTLAQIKSQITNVPGGDITVGQMYVTSDGKTRIHCHFGEGVLTPYLGLGVNGTVVVDWGDGSATDTITGSSLTTVKQVQHTYLQGDYVITLTVSSGSISLIGGQYASHILKRNTSSSSYIHEAYCAAIRRIELGENVTIKSYAFLYCDNLESITIPSGISEMGDYAFQQCSSLTSITIPNSVTTINSSALYFCRNVRFIATPSSITRINSSAFSGCSSLTSITIPDGVTSILSNAFSSCSGLTSIVIPDSVTSIDNTVFQSCSSLTSITIPNSVTTINSSMFNNCSGLTSITIPNSVTSIGASAFSGCRNLTFITMPDSVTSIGASAFKGCSFLTSITIPDGVTSISANTFQNCSSLTSITIPDSVTSIGNYAFSYCSRLTSIVIPDSVTSIGTYAFQNCSLTSIVIPSNITSINDYVFDNCDFRSIIIPDGVTSIGSHAFYFCMNLTSIIIPNSVTSIADQAFYQCERLASITIPSGVTSIGAQAFYNCYNIAEYHLLPTTPPALANSNAFTNILSGCVIYVPYSSDHSILEAYKAASNWSTYASKMQEEPQ